MSDSAIVVCPSCGAKNRVPVAATGRPRCAKCKGALPWVVAADDTDLATALDTKRLVLIDLWAPWCGPCRMVAPILERLASRHAGALKVVKVNVDHSPAAAQRFGAQSIPMIVVLDEGRVVDTLIGAQPAPILRARITGALERRQQ